MRVNQEAKKLQQAGSIYARLVFGDDTHIEASHWKDHNEFTIFLQDGMEARMMADALRELADALEKTAEENDE